MNTLNTTRNNNGMNLARARRGVAAALLLVPVFVYSQTLQPSDKSFVMDAAMGGMTEVELGKLAQQNASNPAVKDFGTHMVDDHSKANDELAGIVKAKGVTPPADLDALHKQAVERLRAMKGDQFDKAFMSQMLTDHKKTIALFQKASTTAKDSDIKAFATKTLPTLHTHLQMAQQTNKAAHSASTKAMPASS
jgi:putative membrane protein